MKPVVKKQNYSIGELYESLANATAEDEASFYRDQLAAKIQRRKQRLNEEGKQKFEELSNGKMWMSGRKKFKRIRHKKQNSTTCYLNIWKPIG